MKEITLKIPDHKFGFFMELISQLGFEALVEDEIPEEHKSLVRERIQTSKAGELISWEEARKQFKFKGKG